MTTPTPDAPREPTAAEFGARLRAARVHAGWGVNEAARQMGVAPARVVEWEKGRYVPRATVVIALVATLGLDPETIFPEFFGRGKKPRKNP